MNYDSSIRSQIIMMVILVYFTGNTGMSFQIWFSLKLSILNKKKELVYTDFRFRSIADIATLITDKVNEIYSRVGCPEICGAYFNYKKSHIL